MKRAAWTGESPNRLRVIYDPIWDTIFPPSDFDCACWVQATDDPTGVEEGSEYIDGINTDEYQLSPIKPWKPDTTKYVEGIQSELEKMLKNQKNNQSYTSKDVDNFVSASSVAVSKKAYLEQGLNKTANKIGLSKPEALAIYHYSRTGFADLNYNLRNDTSDDFTISFEKILNAALNKMPTHEGTAYRGVDLSKSVTNKYLSAFRSGGIITHEYFTSSTIDEDIAKECGSVQFIIKSKKGKYINDLSAHGEIKNTIDNEPGIKQEKEVLFKSKSKFKVTNHDVVNNSLVIEMEEI